MAATFTGGHHRLNQFKIQTEPHGSFMFDKIVTLYIYQVHNIILLAPVCVSHHGFGRAMAALKHNSSGGAFRPFTSGYSLLIPRPSVCLLVFCAVVSLAGSSVSVAGLLASSAVQQWVARSFALDYWQRAEFPPILMLMYIV